MSVPAGKPNGQTLDAERGPIWGSRLGWVAGMDAGGRLLVDFEGNLAGPLPAKRTLSLSQEALREAVATQQCAVLLFEDGDPGLPLVIGLEQAPSPTPLLDAMLEQAGSEPPASVASYVDGQRVVIEGRDEVVLRCGHASITLRRNGRVVIRGVYVETHSAGVNRIKGGSVQVN